MLAYVNNNLKITIKKRPRLTNHTYFQPKTKKSWKPYEQADQLVVRYTSNIMTEIKTVPGL